MREDGEQYCCRQYAALRTDREGHRGVERQTDRETERDTEKKTDTQRDTDI